MVRLSKTGLILVVILIAVVLGATGYIFWTVNNADQLSPYDSEAAAPADQSSCGGCAGLNTAWKWSKKDDACKKTLDKVNCGKSEIPSKNTCNGNSAGGCQPKNPGDSCGNGGKCVNVEGKEGDVQCSCQGGVKEPKEPVVEPTNTCEGGALTAPAAGVKGVIGEPITISGHAFDADGITKNAIAVTVDGVEVGMATATNACPSGNVSVCTAVGSAKKPVVWSYSFTPTKKSHQISVAWKDAKGKGGTACTKSATITSTAKVVTTADWSLSSSAAALSCQNTEGANVSAVASYTITVGNVGDGVGTLSRVEVVLDDAVQESFILTEGISPSATVAGNVITWNLSGAAASFAVGASKTYTFAIDVPKASYGDFVHEVTVVPSGEGSANVEQAVTSTILCTVDGEVPETAIFDSAVGQIVFSFVLISLGYLYLKGYDRSVLNLLGNGYRKASDSYVSVFGEQAKVERSRRKFERKIR